MQNEPSSPNPWVTMWARPRSTNQAIIDADPRRNVLLLAALAGIVEMLGNCLVAATVIVLPVALVVMIVAMLTNL